MSKIVLASNNNHKIKEFTKILNQEDFHLIPQGQLNISEVEETGKTFIENAILKARNAANIAKMPSISDDSGIEVDALLGRPGIYSARYAGEECDDKKNNQLLLKELKNVPFEKRTARYHCTIVFMPTYDHPDPKIYKGTWEGIIGLKETGENGFGYDPLFFLPDRKCTSAELSEELKNEISHRGKAIKLFEKDFLEIIKNSRYF
jgi:XTP/dITP diphosphohydrolase